VTNVFTWLKGKFNQVRKSRVDIGAEDEKAISEALGTRAIRSVSARNEVRIGGVLTSVTYPARPGAIDLSATLSDGTGTIELVWMGRDDIPGIAPGAHMVLEGMVSEDRDHLRIVNPAYSLLASAK